MATRSERLEGFAIDRLALDGGQVEIFQTAHIDGGHLAAFGLLPTPNGAQPQRLQKLMLG